MKNNKTKTFKKGDTVVMLFHMYGLTSESEREIIKVNKKEGTVTLDTNSDPNRCFRFHMTTGTCVNDETWGGAKRTLKV